MNGKTIFCLLVLMGWTSPLWAEASQKTSGGGFLSSFGVAVALLGLVGLMLMEFVYKKKLSRRVYHWALFLYLMVIPLISISSSTTYMMAETKKVESCSTCHVMKPFVDDLKNPLSSTLAARHYKNKYIARDQCYSCHTTYGAQGNFEAKRDGFRHWVLYVSGNSSDPIQYSGSYPNTNCLTCHEGTQKFANVKSHQALLKEFLVTDKISCVSCHGPAHPAPKDRQMMKGGK